jgi:hypothetical protein
MRHRIDSTPCNIPLQHIVFGLIKHNTPILQRMSFRLSSPVVCDQGIVPKIIFIIPYRDRASQLAIFLDKMRDVLSIYTPDEYQLWIMHQCDTRSFNRGALKNLGFWICKQKYPNSYHNITLVFNDVDSVTSQPGVFDFETVSGTVKHFYGFKHGLGGIFAMTAGDFEHIDGFPNFWGWGYEDNSILHRVIRARLTLDYSQFIPWQQSQYVGYDTPNSRDQLQNNDNDFTREINAAEFKRYFSGTREGVHNLDKVVYTSVVDKGNKKAIWMNITAFSTGVEEDMSQRKMYDIRNGQNPFKTKGNKHVEKRIQLIR